MQFSISSMSFFLNLGARVHISMANSKNRNKTPKIIEIKLSKASVKQSSFFFGLGEKKLYV